MHLISIQSISQVDAWSHSFLQVLCYLIHMDRNRSTIPRPVGCWWCESLRLTCSHGPFSYVQRNAGVFPVERSHVPRGTFQPCRLLRCSLMICWNCSTPYYVSPHRKIIKLIKICLTVCAISESYLVLFSADSPHEATMRISREQLPQQETKGNKFIILVAQANTPQIQFENRQTILLSHQAGFVFIQTDKPLYTPSQRGKESFNIVKSV